MKVHAVDAKSAESAKKFAKRMVANKKLYHIFHIYDTDGGSGDAVTQSDLVGTVYATPDEIAEFLARWDKPEIYDQPYASLYHHHVIAEEVIIAEISGIVPYPEYHDPWDDFVIEEEEGE